jgi:hypothetical protein
MTKLIGAAIGALAATAALGTASATAATPGSGSLPTVDGRTVTYVKATGSKGPAAGTLVAGHECDEVASSINAEIAAGLSLVHGGRMDLAAERFKAASDLLETSRNEGLCTIE